LVEQRSPKPTVGSSNLSAPATFYTMCAKSEIKNRFKQVSF